MQGIPQNNAGQNVGNNLNVSLRNNNASSNTTQNLDPELVKQKLGSKKEMATFLEMDAYLYIHPASCSNSK